MRVRRALVDDADAIERTRTDTWRVAYRGLMPDSLLDGLGYDATRRRSLMSALPPHQFVLVAEADDAVCAIYCGVRAAHTPSSRRRRSRAVRPARASGRGIGRALLEAAATELADRGLRSMIIWVLRENAPSRLFDERMGGVHVRDEVHELEGVRITESGYGWENTRVLIRSAQA